MLIYIIWIQVAETNLMKSVTSSIWSPPGFFPCRYQSADSSLRERCSSGNQWPCPHGDEHKHCKLITIHLFAIKDFNMVLVYLSLCSGPSAATSPGLKQTWPYQLSALTHSLTQFTKIKSGIRNVQLFTTTFTDAERTLFICHLRDTWWNETLSAINMEMSMFVVHV